MSFLVIGITGGVGAGKSTILSYLKKEYDAYILMADLIAKRLMEPGGETYEQVVSEFGRDILDENGFIKKETLAERIFQSGYGTTKINDMVHPAVVRHIQKRIEAKRLESVISPDNELRLAVVEAALLFEGHADVLCDELWYIHVDPEQRIERLMRDRGYTREKCEAIIASQLDEAEFRNRCDIVIDNSREFEDVKKQIDAQIIRIKNEIEKGYTTV